MRLVRFTDDDGSSKYYGTYTAYNGFRIFPQLLSFVQEGSIQVHMLTEAEEQRDNALPHQIGSNSRWSPG